jgi:amidohydrolase
MIDEGLRSRIAASARELSPNLVAWRRHLHRHPELSQHETRTTEYAARHLRALGLSPILEPGKTGLFVDIVGREGGGRVALRADIDALPIPDAKDVSYRSTCEDVSHACGHDAHTAMLMGVAQLVGALGDDLPGTVRLVFQPSEERSPGGADEMIRRGVMDGVDAIMALHMAPELPTGTIGLRPGAITASVAAFRITVRGRGGHPARPHLAVDPVLVVARLVQDIMLAMGRRLDVREPVLVTIGEIHGGRAPNVIPGSASLAGSVRTASMAQMERVPDLIRELADSATAMWGGAYEFDFRRGSDPVHNDPALVHRVRNLVTDLLGAEFNRWMDKPSMGGEDFSRYLEHAPGLMARLGSTAAGAPAPDLHTNTFDIDEDALWHGVAVMAGTAVEMLTRREP